MMIINKYMSIIILVLASFLLFSCGGSESYRIYEEEENQTENYGGNRGYRMNFNTPSDVRVELSHQTFRDDSGNSITFGSSASNVSVNGTAWGGAVSVEEFGKNSDGFPYAVFSFNTPYGETTWILTQTYRSIYIFDVRDPGTLYYK